MKIGVKSSRCGQVLKMQASCEDVGQVVKVQASVEDAGNWSRCGQVVKVRASGQRAGIYSLIFALREVQTHYTNSDVDRLKC